MKFYLGLTLAFISISVFGQTVNFSLNGGAQYIPPESFQSEERELTSRQIRPLADSLWEHTNSTRKYIAIQEYNPKVGITVTGNIYIKITDRFNLKTGLGLNYLLKFRMSPHCKIQLVNFCQNRIVSHL